MQISFSPNITSIYILYKDNFTKSDVDVLTRRWLKCLHHQ